MQVIRILFFVKWPYSNDWHEPLIVRPRVDLQDFVRNIGALTRYPSLPIDKSRIHTRRKRSRR